MAALVTTGPDDWVTVREVGPRDGLQVEAPMPVEDRLRMIGELVSAGLSCLEVAAFVSPSRVPAMAGAAEVLAGLADVTAGPRGHGATARADASRGSADVAFFVLVPNLRGAQLATDAGAKAMTVTVAASDTYSRSNVGRSRDDASEEVERILESVAGSVPVDVVVSCAFGYAGREPADLAWIEQSIGRWADAGPCSLTLADTTGEAGPPAVAEAVDRFGPDFGLHLHQTRANALVTAYAALDLGVRRFDTSVAGLGGSPFSENAAGNLATEDLVHLLGLLGMPCGVDLGRLLDESRRIGRVLGRPPGPLASVGPSVAFRR